MGKCIVPVFGRYLLGRLFVKGKIAGGVTRLIIDIPVDGLVTFYTQNLGEEELVIEVLDVCKFSVATKEDGDGTQS